MGKRSEASGFLLAWGMSCPWAAGIWFQETLKSTLPFSLWVAEKECVPRSLGVWRVSLWSSEARICFCLSVQPPSFRVFLTPPSSLLLESVCCMGCVSVSGVGVRALQQGGQVSLWER